MSEARPGDWTRSWVVRVTDLSHRSGPVTELVGPLDLDSAVELATELRRDLDMIRVERVALRSEEEFRAELEGGERRQS